jgi:hypothetical protein
MWVQQRRSFDFAQDFASRLRRLLSGSSSNPSGPASLIAVIGRSDHRVIGQHIFTADNADMRGSGRAKGQLKWKYQQVDKGLEASG